MSLVVDSSVAIKWFVPEEQHGRALALLEIHDGEFEAPDFIAVEVANVTWKKVRRGEIAKSLAPEIVGGIRDYFDLLHPSPSLVDRALALATALNHPVYDCLYLACAEVAGCPLVTADRRFMTAVCATPYEGSVQLLEDVVA